ncbi:FAD-dependent oxidoreductase [uncultured Kiloniella sp.]|uniref:FAD-dependent oxidoreductase n=1 Tax=uncultured Kiloniella sp. TaxID=1133091 RepID=UPI002634297D|nr:FAD-dependent oxidoreductase [uncultured Kiloniella sp.]
MPSSNARYSRYDILFEPIKIGPVTMKNRFYQVPHCNGMGYARPQSLAAMRGIKAEGGWGAVCTEEVEIHPSSEISPSIEGRLWDKSDIPAHRLMTSAVHEHDALAGIELVHNGFHAPNRTSRLPPMAPSPIPVDSYDPVHARAMDLTDIKNFRKWHRQAALNAREAGYDIIYVYAGHCMTTLMHFMLERFNHRSDNYGGTIKNRVRLTREVISEVKDAVGDQCAIAFRFAVDELMGKGGMTSEGEAQEVVGLLAELPDLWDVNISGWSHDSSTARFEPIEGYQEKYTSFVKSLTTKPVVGVGRFTSPDAMVSQIKRGVLDLIGAARPSIADPFLPNKIAQGRIDEIRECIGCNICVSGDNLSVPIRCTQNPTMGEEWRRKWHPEKIAPKASDSSVLVVGAGPSGLEAALQLANRGYQVTLAEAGKDLGGRATKESQLPGLSSYARVRDYRVNLLTQMANVEIYKDSPLDEDAILDFGFPHVLLATGSHWRRDGTGRYHQHPIPGLDTIPSFTPDDIMDGEIPTGHIVIFDDDHYYMGGVLAEKLINAGHKVTLVTPAAKVSAWSEYTLEQEKIQAKLINLGVELITNQAISHVTESKIELSCTYTGKTKNIQGDSLLLITARYANDALFHQLESDPDKLNKAGIKTLEVIGDAYSPGSLASAVYYGHLAARCLEGESWDAALFGGERPGLIS